MTNTEAMERICKIVTLEASDNRMELVQPSEMLEALGFDSLGKHTLSMRLEDEFHIDIECGTEDAWTTVQDVIDSVSNELGLKTPEEWADYATGAIPDQAAKISNGKEYGCSLTPLGLAYVALKLNGEVGEFAEHVGKAMRDDGLISLGEAHHPAYNDHLKIIEYASISDERRSLIIKEIENLVWTQLKKGQVQNAKRVLLYGDQTAIVELENGRYTVIGRHHSPNGGFAVLNYGLDHFSQAVLHGLARMGVLDKKQVAAHIATTGERSKARERKQDMRRIRELCEANGIPVPEGVKENE